MYKDSLPDNVSWPVTTAIVTIKTNGMSASQVIRVVPGQPTQFQFTVDGVDANGCPSVWDNVMGNEIKEECVKCDLTIRRKFKLEVSGESGDSGCEKTE